MGSPVELLEPNMGSPVELLEPKNPDDVAVTVVEFFAGLCAADQAETSGAIELPAGDRALVNGDRPR
jgi:hypothetical protein